MADSIAKVVVLDRSVYNSIIKDNSTIYFVREPSSESSKMVSLYVGLAKQCDMLDITDDTDVSFNPTTNEYIIPSRYQVPDKLLFYTQTITTDAPDTNGTNIPTTYDFFRLSMWSASKGKFLDCTGFPNNVVVCKNGSHPSTADGIKDFVYVDVTNRNIWVFDGNAYVPIIQLDQYATITWVEEYVASHTSSVAVDNVTILKDQNDTLHGAGADVSGVIFPQAGSNGYAAKDGAHTYNSYPTMLIDSGTGTRTASGTGYNRALYPMSSVFGYNNTEVGKSSYHSKRADEPASFGSNMISGIGNSVSDAKANLVVGQSNSIIGCHLCGGNIIGGYGNVLKRKASSSADKSGYLDGAHMLGINSVVNKYNFDEYYDLIIGKSVSLGRYDAQSNIDVTSGTFGIVGGYDTTVINGENEPTNIIMSGYSHACGHMLGNYILGHSCSVGNESFVDRMTFTNNLFLGSNVLTSPDSGNGSGLDGGQVDYSIIVDGKIQKEGHYSHIYLFGYNNEAAADTTITFLTRELKEVYCFSKGAYATKSNCVYIGTYNDTTTLSSVDPALILGNGSGNSGAADERSTALVISKDGTVYSVDGDFTNVSKDVSLVSDINDLDLTPSSGAVTLSTLPENGDQNIISTTDTVASITVSALNVPIGATTSPVATVEDYCATIVFKKSATLSDINLAMTNFDPASQSPRIYLMNPGLDITNYTVIHLLLFYDGMNVCCIAGGYEEDTPL